MPFVRSERTRTAGAGHNVRKASLDTRHGVALAFNIKQSSDLAAVALMRLAAADHEPGIGIVTTAFLSWWAGVDMAIGAWPLLGGRPYRFDGPIPADPVVDDDDDEDPETERWERM